MKHHHEHHGNREPSHMKGKEKGPDHGGHERLRDWAAPSYNEEGRYTTLGGHEHGATNEIPKGHGNGMREMPKDAADPGRRNK